MALNELLDSTLNNMGYELVDVELSSSGKLLRVFVDKEGGISIDDCGHYKYQFRPVGER